MRVGGVDDGWTEACPYALVEAAYLINTVYWPVHPFVDETNTAFDRVHVNEEAARFYAVEPRVHCH